MVKRVKAKFEEERQRSIPPLVAKNKNQQRYISYLKEKKLVVGTGWPGSGKTYIAAYHAAQEFQKGKIERIIIARPYVTMGANAGAIPGDDFEKLYPFVRSMLDVLKESLGVNIYENLLRSHRIEIQPIEKIRGRSFDDPCICVIDEAQNTTPDQIKSIVTRIGDGCQMILCGDPKQTDIKGTNGLDFLTNILMNRYIPDTAVVFFQKEDIVRSGMVKDFIIAFEETK